MDYNEDWNVELILRNARVPYLRALYVPLNIKCDITFSNGVACKNSDLLEHLFDLQPEAAKFTIFIKNYVNSSGIKMKNYAIVLLSIFYLQQRNYMPSIKKVQSFAETLEIDGKITDIKILEKSINNLHL
jgi:DNA polymerase sigma